MDRASDKLATGTLLGAAVLAMGVALPHSAPRAATQAEGMNLFASSLACGPAETLVGAATGSFLFRVRADASARRHEAAKARFAGRQGTRKAPRSSAPAPQSAGKAPRTDDEPNAAVLRSFYTCNAATVPNLAEGTGWRLVGPLRHS